MHRKLNETEKLGTAPATAVATELESKTFTNWGAFKKASLTPVQILCTEYQPFHTSVTGCHSRLLLTAEAMLQHITADHGGGFQLTLVQAAKPWDGWDKLEAAGLEAADFRCDVCDAVLRLTPSNILKHMRTHISKFRRAQEGGVFNLTLSTLPSVADANEEFDNA